MQKNIVRVLGIAALFIGTLACSLTVPNEGDPNAGVPQQPQVAAGELSVVLAAPLDGATYYEGVPVNVLARVENAGQDIDRAEILIDNAVVTTLPVPNPAGAPVFTLAQSWEASGIGTHQVAVNIFRGDGSSASSSVSTIEIVNPDGSAQVIVDNSAGATDSGGAGGILSEIRGGDNNDAGADANGEDSAPVIEDAPSIDSPPEQPAATQPPLPTSVPTEPPPPTPTPTPDTPQATVLVGANVRQGPGTQFGVLGAYAAGETVDALGVNPDGSWYKIQFYNAEGWVLGELLTVTGADQLPVDVGPPTPTPIPPTPTPVPVTNTPVPAQVNQVFEGAVQIDPYPPECGQTMTFTITVRNDGSEEMPSSAAMRIVDTHVDSGTTTETTAPIPQLGAGETRTIGDIFLTVDTNFGTTHRIQVILDANNQIQETNEGDNSSRAEALEYELDQGSC